MADQELRQQQKPERKQISVLGRSALMPAPTTVIPSSSKRNVILKQTKTTTNSPTGSAHGIVAYVDDQNSYNRNKQSNRSVNQSSKSTHGGGGRKTHVSKRQLYTIETEGVVMPQIIKDYNYVEGLPPQYGGRAVLPGSKTSMAGSYNGVIPNQRVSAQTGLNWNKQATTSPLKFVGRDGDRISHLSWDSSNKRGGVMQTSPDKRDSSELQAKHNASALKELITTGGGANEDQVLQQQDRTLADDLKEQEPSSRARNHFVTVSSLDGDSKSRLAAGKKSAARFNMAQSPSQLAYVQRNQGIKDIVMRSIQQTESINFDRGFKKREQPKDVNVRGNIKKQVGFSNSKLSNYNSVNDHLQTMPIEEVSKNRLEQLPKVKGLKDTMKFMMTSYQGQTFNLPDDIVCNKFQSGEIAVENSYSSRNRQSAMSQTVSSSFFNSKYKAHPFAKVKHMTDESVRGVVEKAFQEGLQRRLRGKSFLDAENTSSSRNRPLSPRSLLRKTQSTMKADISSNITGNNPFLHRDLDSGLSQIPQEKDIVQKQGSTVRLDNLQSTFESLDFVNQAQVLRIGLNEKRFNRFLTMYDSKKGEMRKKIDKLGRQTALSKSVDVAALLKELGRASPTLGKVIDKPFEEISLPDNIQIVAPQKKVSQVRKLPGLVNAEKIDTKFLTVHDSPEKLQLTVALRKKPKVKPYQPPEQLLKTKHQLEEMEKKKADEYEEMQRLQHELAKPKPSQMQLLMSPDNATLQRLSTFKAVSQKPSIRDLRASNLGVLHEYSNDQSPSQSLNSSIQRVREEIQIEEDLLEESSMWSDDDDDSFRTSLMESLNVQKAIEQLEVESATSVKIAQQKMKQEKLMNKIMAQMKLKTHKLAQKNAAKKMFGQSQFKFPSQVVLKERTENEVQEKFEKATEEALGLSPSYAIAMVQSTKEAVVPQVEPTEEEIKSHVQFLTDHTKMSTSGEDGIFQKDPLNKKPGADYSFDELCDIEKRAMQDNADEFDKKVLYSQINKVSNVTKIQELKAEHPEYIYYMECSQDTDTPLPILSHIFSNTLALANYTLSAGHCRALNRAAKYLQTNINRVRFDNCGIDDGEMADLLQAFTQFRDFKSIIYRKNDFQEESLECVKRLFSKSIPYHLEEFRISNCKLTPNVTSELISAIHHRSFLKQFEIANAPLSDQDIQSLSEYMNQSKHLVEFDLQMNDMRPAKMDILLSHLRENKRLSQINIAHNNIVESFQGKDEKQVAGIEARVSGHLSTFLSTNKKLIHLNLTSTNLSEKILIELLPVIKKAKLLQGIHLSGNPGVTETLKTEIRALMKTKEPAQPKRFNLAQLLMPETMQRLEQTFLREAVKIKQINMAKRIVQNGATDDKFFSIQSKLILMRYLHHKDEIPGSGQWQMLTKRSDHCWICDCEMKGYIFWRRGMARDSKKLIPTNHREKMNIFEELNQIKAHNELIPARPKPFIPENPKSPNRVKKAKLAQEAEEEPQPTWRKDPTICGQFTNWKPRRMVPLFDFLQGKEKAEDKLDYRNVFNHFVRQFKWGTQYHIEKFEECTKHHLNVMDAYISQRKKELYCDWQYRLEKQFTYKKPFFVNSEEVRDRDFDEVFVAPVFAKSGRQCFVVQPGDDAATIELYKAVNNFRQEQVAGPLQQAAASQSVRVFKKPASVFARWKSDSEQTREKGFYDHDANFWKLERFVKDPLQREKVENLIFDSFFLLKSIFIEVCAETAFPQMTMIGWSSFCQRVGLVDNKHLELQDVDRFFIASRLEDGGKVVKQQNLSRFMFFEAICRAGLKRFYNYGTGECASPSEAIQKTIEVIKTNWVQDNWEGWRDKYLYNFPVNDVIQANQNELRALYKLFVKPKAKFLDLDDALKLFMQVPDVGLSASQVQYCFGMSKMTMVYERDTKVSPGYTELDFVEFLEMIGRVAYTKFQGSELQDLIDTATKIEYLLDDLFVLIEAERNEREEELQVSSGSEDSDY